MFEKRLKDSLKKAFPEQEFSISLAKGCDEESDDGYSETLTIRVKGSYNRLKTVCDLAGMTYPSCCGIYLLRDMNCNLTNFSQAVKVLTICLNEIIEECSLDEEDGDFYNAPFGMIMMTHTNKHCWEALVKAGFQEIATFDNPKTGNEIKTFIYYV